jgi:glyoxylase-like metal-dependent hydrolase (beta-lactamase superfamily II)
MKAAQVADNESVPGALPVVTFSEDVTFHWNGQTTHVHHVAPAHTDGDAVVFFEEANVLHMGDTYFATGYPYVDLASGGGIDGVIAAADYALSKANASTKIIPGHGPLSTPADLRVYRDVLATVRAAVAAAVADGKTLEETLAMKPSAAYDEKWGGGFINPERFVTTLWNSLSGLK